MSKRRKNALRFAAGSPSEYRSAVWRLWIDRDDTYLTARVRGGLIKLSMHASGIWRFAWTSESGQLSRHGHDRVEERWVCPPEFRQGWIQGPSVIVPNTGLLRPFAHILEDECPEIIWCPSPRPGRKQHFTILFRTMEAADRDIAGALGAGDELIGVLPLRTRGSVLLSRREVRMVAKERDYILPLVANMKITYDPRPASCAASLFTPGTDDAGHPYVLDSLLAGRTSTVADR